MSRRTKAQQAERAEAIAQLREWIKPGDTVYTILDSVSRSGMSRTIRVVLLSCGEDGRPVDLHPNHAVGLAIDARMTKRGDALVIGGCGMDMGFHVVNSLSEVLYGYLRCEACGKFPEHDPQRMAPRAGDQPACLHCGAALVGGYACLGKGKCPSNYHVNRRNRVRCEGTRVYNPDGPDTGEFCWRPSSWHGEGIPAGWPRRVIDIGEGQTVDGGPYACVGDLDAKTLQVCPTCQGAGDVPNPDGPERFDLLHTDGYALRHRWL